MIKLLIFISLVFTACNQSNPRYEYIEKDNAFRKKIGKENFVKAQHGFTYFESQNIASDEILVFIHGFSVPSYIWDETYYEAANRGLGVVRLDLYGRGFSSNPDVAYNDLLYADQVVDLLESLRITKKVNFIGLSNGGRVISRIATKYPGIVKRLIYVAPGGFHDTNTEPDLTPVSDTEIDEFINKNYSDIAKGQLADFKYPERFSGWDTKYEELLKYKGFARALLSTSRNNFLLEDINREIGKTGLPHYAIWGDSDIVLPLDEVKNKLMKLMPKLKLFVIEDSGHLPHKEQIAQFNAVFFNKIFNLLHKDVTSSEALNMYESEENIFLDVRTNAEHIQSFIPNSILIPLNELPYKIDELERFRSKNIVVYCRVGNRSEFATKLLLDEGYRATNLLGGIAGWTGPVKP
tara:strand:+ start:1958 stop:3181 length:1224 start_codon:yes stop_codon:yes gene_type:complete